MASYWRTHGIHPIRKVTPEGSSVVKVPTVSGGAR